MLIFLNLLDTEDEIARFIALYDTYKDLLYWIARKKVKTDQDAEDCVQETFLYVAKNFNKIDSIASKRTKAYLSTIVTGFAIDIFNKSLNNDSIDFNIIYEVDEAYNFDGYKAIDLICVFDDTLDEESKILFYLKYIYGYKSSEIAEIYKAKDTYIRKKLQYAKEKLRKALEERR